MTTAEAQPEPVPAIDIQGVGFTYPSSGIANPPVEALNGITMRVDAGTRLGILGPNGGGKSTLIALILGSLVPESGSIRVFGKSAAQAMREGLVGYLPQKIEAQREWPISVREMVGLPIACRLKPWQSLDAACKESIESSIDMVGMGDFSERPIGSLSGGQLQRTMIARAIAGKPKLLVLDEPTVGIDVSGQQQFAELVNTLHKQLGLTSVVVTHDLRAIAAVADRVACLSRTLHFHDAAEGLTPQVLADVFAHDVAAVFGDVHIDAHLAAECEDPSHTHPSDGCCGHDHSGGCS